MGPLTSLAAQAIMAGNFLNLALFIALLQAGDVKGQLAVLASWACAYVSAFLSEVWPPDPFSKSANTFFHLSLVFACIAFSGVAFYRWFF